MNYYDGTRKHNCIDDAWSLSYDVSYYRTVWIRFNDGKLDCTTYTDYSASQSGEIKLGSLDTTYDYKLDGANIIIVDGTSYQYTINEEKGYVEFLDHFLESPKSGA